jgi:hypothetical protein
MILRIIGTCGAILFFLFPGPVLSLPSIFFLLIGLVLLGISALRMVDQKRARIAIWKEVRDSEFRMCLKCAYRLIGLSDCGLCPECGEMYEMKELNQTWCRWAGLFNILWWGDRELSRKK